MESMSPFSAGSIGGGAPVLETSIWKMPSLKTIGLCSSGRGISSSSAESSCIARRKESRGFRSAASKKPEACDSLKAEAKYRRRPGEKEALAVSGSNFMMIALQYSDWPPKARPGSLSTTWFRFARSLW